MSDTTKNNTLPVKLYPVDPKKLGIKEEPFMNIPIINHLQECAEIYRLIHNDEFRKRCRSAGPSSPVSAIYFEWYGRGDDLLTLLLQRAILGTESFVTSIVLQELVQRGLADKEVGQYIRNPFLLGGGTAKSYYSKLPGLIDPSLSLDQSNPRLWEDVRTFYKDVRNKIFHGRRINSHDPAALHPYFETLRQLYLWMDSWFEERISTLLPVDIRKYWPDVK